MKQLLKTVATALIGAIIGYVFGKITGGSGSEIYCAVLFSGIVYGWRVMNRVLGTLVSTNLGLMAVFFILKIVGAVLIGWICLIIEIAKSIVALVKDIIANKPNKAVASTETIAIEEDSEAV